jgi:succinate dehydrogenase / fumarate reductase flavoprotein subunit
MIDILIVGSGGAGLTAAIQAASKSVKVTVVSKTYPTSSQTLQAQGGINAVLNTQIDSVESHISDTLKSANGLGNEQSIRYMCENSADTIQWLDQLGVPFSRNIDNGIAQRELGGASSPRACYSSDYTGLKILHTLYDTCLKEKIEFINEHMLLNLIIENNTVKGITCLDIKTAQVKQILSKKVIIATGGYGGIYSNYNTNSTATTGDGIAAAQRAGVALENMEYIQFHPTALKGSCILVSESARGEGGYLVTSDGQRFVDELQPRDIVAREIFKKIELGYEVFLDLRHISKEKILKVMPQEYNICLQYMNLKLDCDLIPINPAAHYTMGGIKTNIDGETNIKNLYAVGECASNGVHGANRLGGNSLLEIITFGRRIAYLATNNLNICIEDKEYQEFLDDKQNIKDIFCLPNNISFYDKKNILGKSLYENVGLFRSKDSLNIMQNILNNLDLNKMGIGDKSTNYNTNLKDFIEFTNIVELSSTIVKAALNNTKSCGAHYRLDDI